MDLPKKIGGKLSRKCLLVVPITWQHNPFHGWLDVRRSAADPVHVYACGCFPQRSSAQDGNCAGDVSADTLIRVPCTRHNDIWRVRTSFCRISPAMSYGNNPQVTTWGLAHLGNCGSMSVDHWAAQASSAAFIRSLAEADSV